MAVDLEQLKNITPFQLDTSLLQGDIPQNLKTNAIFLADGWYGFTVMLILFAFFVWYYYRKDGDILFDIPRAGLWASGITTILGLVMVSLGFIETFKHVVWYGTIFVIFLVATIQTKFKGN